MDATTEVAWDVQRFPRSPYGPHGIRQRRADVSPTEYLTVKREDGEWRWDVFTIRQHDPLGRPVRLDGGSRSTLATAKAAALSAWQRHVVTQ